MNRSATASPDTTGDDRALSVDELRAKDAYWRACNHLALGMLYLRDKMRTVGHVATFTPRFYRPA